MSLSSNRGIRRQVTAVAAASVASVLIVAGFGLVTAQRRILTDSLDASLDARTADLVIAAQAGQLPAVLADAGPERFTQVVADDGSVLSATPNLVAAGALTAVFGTSPEHRTVDGLPVDDDRFRVATAVIDGIGLVHEGTSFDGVAEASGALTALLTGVVPILVLVVGAIVWRVVGRTLHPVEVIRARVTEIGGTDLASRVPEPGTGDEIDRLASTMNEMLNRLEESAARQARFVADASHELRSPLARLQASIDLFRRGEDSDRDLASMAQDVGEMSRLVDDLLFIAWSEGGRGGSGRGGFQPVEIEDVIVEEVSSIRQRAKVTVELGSIEAITVVGDRRRLSRLFRNLMENAVRHAASRVLVSARVLDDVARITVTDDGPGVPGEHAETIFEPFVRVDEARTRDDGGAGLGLSIAREIALLHGGDITLDNPGRPGAVFAVTLPAESGGGTAERQR